MSTTLGGLRELSEEEAEQASGGEHRPSDPPLQFPEWPDELFGWTGDL